ncbi:MAG: energy transducer TonB [Fodinibius sp.]|nr:energy transducer TonB [Fodinibius sp.]
MSNERKKQTADLRKYHTLFLECGLIAVLLVFIVAMKVDLRVNNEKVAFIEQQEVIKMEEIIQTKQIERPPPPPSPPVPVEVPNDEIIEDEVLDINAEFDLDQPIELPPAPKEAPEQEEDFFLAVEQMPELIGGLAGLQRSISYPEMARRAGIEGKVTVQFIVTEDGTVENPRVIRGIGGGCDEEAIRAVTQAKFKPGRQRGKAVRVQYSLPVVFRLQS